MNQQPRSFKTPKGTELPLLDIKGKPYLSVQHRVMWFREDHPDYSIETEFINTASTAALAKATIRDQTGRVLATGHKYEDQKGFEDFREKSESSAIGRALGFLGYGTQFALDLEEGQRLADAPTNEITPTQTYPIANNFPEPTNDDNQDAGDYVVTFGKYKNKTIREVVDKDGQFKIASYVEWLEADAKQKKKPISETAQDFIDAFNAFVGHRELDNAVEKPKESLEEKMNRLKNEHPGVRGPPMRVPYKDDNEPPFPEFNPEEQLPDFMR